MAFAPVSSETCWEISFSNRVITIKVIFWVSPRSPEGRGEKSRTVVARRDFYAEPLELFPISKSGKATVARRGEFANLKPDLELFGVYKSGKSQKEQKIH